MRCDWQNFASLFFVGILLGGGSLYIIELKATPDQVSLEPGHRRGLANLPTLRQYPGGTSDARSVKTLDYGRTATLGAELQSDDPSNLDTFHDVLGPKAGLQQAAVPRNMALEAPTSAKPNAVSLKTFDRPATAPTPLPRALAAAARPSQSSAGQLPHYEVLHAINDFNSTRIYAELLIPGLPRDMPEKSLKRLLRAIAEYEGFDNMTVYRTRLARKAHYSMSFADAHPEALAEGLVGNYRRGRFKAHKPKTR